MKSLGEIIEHAKQGHMPTHEECYWAMLALDGLSSFDRSDFQRLINPSKFMTPERVYNNRVERMKRTLSTDPKKWLGPNENPRTESYQKRRKISLAIFEKALNGELPNQKTKSRDQGRGSEG